MPQGIHKEHLSMCGIEITNGKNTKVKKPTCLNCRRVMRSMLKVNKFYELFL